ncbi:hypothetical protein FOMPIDRAFT_89052 [Fomitopsis schrenkii]|uniref:Fungal-type protein kinase domain-containing protein n=1 Tax=Fomitopsis schrenkii TaxID=2126942 RepID=S8EJ36_FOMSC|nr:hypothetical protein FOMPIDRAFT_89052 [Fomitopsis schrenkii]
MNLLSLGVNLPPFALPLLPHIPTSTATNSPFYTNADDFATMSDKATPQQRRPAMYHADAAEAKQNNPDDEVGWHEQIHDRIREYPLKIEAYLKDMVPAAGRVPKCPKVKDLFQEVPIRGAENDMYPPMINALTKLVESFPDDQRPRFHNYGSKIMKFPYQHYNEEHHPTKPDIIATVPSIPVVTPLYRWRHVALVFELKIDAQADPLIMHTPTHWRTLVQLAKGARNIMLSQGRLYAFVIGVYGDIARIFRFDRAGAICSPTFKYREQPKILHEFLWRLFHPKLIDCDIVGADPTVTLGTPADRERADQWATAADPEWGRTAETRKACRQITVGEGDEKKTYLVYKLLFVNPGLFSRATLVWEAFDLNETPSIPSERKRYIIKESWGGLARTSETKHYQDILRSAGGSDLTGIAKFVVGDDAGRREERDRVEGERKKAMNPRARNFVRAGHLTVGGFHHAPEKNRWNERSLTRIVLETVGTPLSEFLTTKELVTAFRDAIKGHHQAYLNGVVHRDVSEGNVMISRDKKQSFSGFIQDFDYSFSWVAFLIKHKDEFGWGDAVDLATWEKYCVEHGHELLQEGDAGNDSKERTGTVFFMAIEILENAITHEARHDLESFYWLLVFVVLRHCAHSHKLGVKAFGQLFCPGAEMQSCALTKRGWINITKPLEVPGNKPLNDLLERFRELCVTNFNRKEETPRMTHKDVLAIFDEALSASSVWPDAAGDAARPWAPPRNAKYSEKVAESMNQEVTRGTIDHTTGGDLRFPRFGPQRPDSKYELSDDEKNKDPDTDDDEAPEDTLPADRDAQPIAVAGDLEMAPPMPVAQDTPATDNENGRPAADEPEPTLNVPRDPSPDGNIFARSSAGEGQAQASSGATGRNMAETWPAAKAGGPSARAERRYNLRSSARGKPAAEATSSLQTDAAAGGSGHVRTRSRAQTTSRPRDNETRDSSVGKRSRDGHDAPEDAELGAESHTSKRPRTLSITRPRGRSSSKKTGKKR